VYFIVSCCVTIIADELGPSAFDKLDRFDLNFAAQPISYK